MVLFSSSNAMTRTTARKLSAENWLLALRLERYDAYALWVNNVDAARRMHTLARQYTANLAILTYLQRV